MKQKTYVVQAVIWALSIFFVLVGCDRQESTKVSLIPDTPANPVSFPSKRPLRIGLGAMCTPKEGYVYYQRLKTLVEKKLHMPVRLVDRQNYDEMNRLIETRGVDAAFVCSGPYVEGRKKFGLELLAMPVVKGKPEYYSYIIVHKDSRYRSLDDLRGKAFAFTDPKSNTGKLAPTYMLARMKETPESFFARYVFTHGHDQSIRAVTEKLVDGAAVDSLVWDYLTVRHPKLTEQTRIVATSEPYGVPPVVVHKDLDPDLKRRLKEVFLSASEDPEGREILKNMNIDRFVAGDDSKYDSIRKMNKWMAAQQDSRK